MQSISGINIFESLSPEDMQDILLRPQTDISQYIKPDDRDILDRGIEEFEENVPLVAQIGYGFTPPGMAHDVITAGKYGRDAFRDFGEGQVKAGLMNTGIAGLSALGAIPLLGDLARGPKSALKKGIKSLDEKPIKVNRDIIRMHQADLNTGNPLADAYKMRARAERLSPEFQEFTQNMARSLNLETTLPELSGKLGSVGEPFGTLKGIPRMVEKTRDKYKGNISGLTDPMRKRVVVNTPAEEEAFVKLLGDSGYQFFDKGRVVKPEGFVDRKINLAFTGSNGEPLVAEIGLITAPMWRASTKQHDFYEEFRAILPDGMPTTAAQRRMINDETFAKAKELDDKMKQIFSDAKNQIDPAFYDVVGSSKKGIANLDVASKDLLEEFNLRGGAKLDSQNNVTLYHRTNKESADKIKKTGKMVGKEDRIYFSTKPSGAIKGYGDELVEVKIPIKDLNIEDIFSDEVHVTLKSNFKPTDVVVKKFASGGYVTSGSSGKSAPITPNLLSKASFDIFEPSSKKSANCFGVATDQSDSFSAMKKPSLPSSYDSMTAGPSSHVKYNLSINPSLQKFTNNYNLNDVSIFEVE